MNSKFPIAARVRTLLPAVVAAVAVAVVFQFFGNATRGYIDTPSLFWWWISQWLDAASETQHGWLILAIGIWLLWRNLRRPFDHAQGRPFDHAQGRPFDHAQGRQGAGHREEGAGSREPFDDAQGEQGALRRCSGRAGGPSTMLRADRGLGTGNKEQGAGIREGLWIPVGAVLAGLALHLVGFAVQQSRISIVGLLACLWGLLALGGGARWGRAAVFPVGFMVFAIPVNVLDSVGFWLRMGVIDATTHLAHAVGIDVLRSGTQLLSPDGRFQYDVAAACSGVRSLMALTALSLLVGYLTFRPWWLRGALVLLSFPLVYLGNVVRISSIIVAAQWGGQDWGARVHDWMGFIVFAVVLGGVLAATGLLRRRVPPRWLTDGPRAENSAGEPPAEAPALPARASFAGGWAMIVIVAATGSEMLLLSRLAARPARMDAGVVLAPDGIDPVELPAFLGTEWIGRRTEVTPVEREILPPDTGFSRKIYVPLTDPSKAILLSIVLSGRDRSSIHRPEICLVGQGWTLTGRSRHEFEFPGRSGAEFPATVLQVEREVTTSHGTQSVTQLVAYWFVSSDGVVAGHWERFLWDAWNRLHLRTDRWAYVLLQTDASDGDEAALSRMQEVLNQTLPAFQRVDH